MQYPNIDILNSFDERHLPDLDVCVLAALELFMKTQVPTFNPSSIPHPLVVGSGNAALAGRAMFAHTSAVFADESSYAAKLTAHHDIEDVVIVSASGGKHAVDIAQNLNGQGRNLWLLSNNPNALARRYVQDKQFVLFPKNREPYTYNVSTYMGMILSSTGEDSARIYEHIETNVVPAIPEDLDSYSAFCMLVPPSVFPVVGMIRTKFDELFGPRVLGRVFTTEEVKHAKTVVPSDKELFISIGEENTQFGDPVRRLHLPLPDNSGFLAALAVGYYMVGHIQKQHSPYFKDSIDAYTKAASKLFGEAVDSIVE